MQKWSNIVETQSDDAWFEDYVRQALAAPTAPLPARFSKVGPCDVQWFETQPQRAFIFAKGGGARDREYARAVLREALAGHGYSLQTFTFYWDHDDKRLIKEADWSDIEAKAKRLIQSGKVKILRNGANVIVGQVEGDHGTYQTEINRDDPNSQAISLWDCECEWDQFAWQRTRQWKKYEGRVCSHVLATYWMAQSMPLDEGEGEPEGEGGGGAPQGPTDMSISPFGQQPGGGGMPPGAGPPGAGGMVAPGMAPLITPGMMPYEQNPMASPIPGVAPPPRMNPETPAPGQAPAPTDIIPPYPMAPENLPVINPISVPGQKPQTPLNPIQNPGGTYSKVAGNRYVNGDIVQLKEADYGTTVGLNSGQSVPIPANSIGEVLGTEGSGEYEMINVYFAGPQASAGIEEPHGVTAWFFSNQLIPRPDIKAPGPAIRRRT